MTFATALLIALGAALGAPTRFVFDRYLNGAWPRGTLLVNLVGSFILGVAAGYALNASETPKLMLALVGVGFCGSLTTFGGFAAQTVDLFALARASDSASSRGAIGYVLASAIGCMMVASLGLAFALQIWAGS
ncbi:MAG: CrcB family protein [Actinomycetes bacterium]|jgi:CrcB protein